VFGDAAAHGSALERRVRRPQAHRLDHALTACTGRQVQVQAQVQAQVQVQAQAVTQMGAVSVPVAAVRKRTTFATAVSPRYTQSWHLFGMDVRGKASAAK
jgi:hypothetical protein